MEEPTARERVWTGIREFLAVLEEVPGWAEWRRQKIAYTLDYDAPEPLASTPELAKEFQFPDAIDMQHAVIMAFLHVEDGRLALKECEYYFRRYPFRGLPVSRHRHIINVCELYFSRFYEIRERVKNLLNTINVAISPERLPVGKFLKIFDRAFDSELRARNSIHHHQRFDDIATNRVFLAEAVATGSDRNPALERAYNAEYRRLALRWAQRVKRRSEFMDRFLEAVAVAMVENCDFVTPKKKHV